MVAVSLDRKSTRLNSSHTIISYAVFCLKKKNINPPHHPAQGPHPVDAPRPPRRPRGRAVRGARDACDPRPGQVADLVFFFLINRPPPNSPLFPSPPLFR